MLHPPQRVLDPWSLTERSVFVGATGSHFASTVSIERMRCLNPALAHRLHSVSFLQSLPRLVAELGTLAPTTLATYPSAAVLLAEERLAGRLEIAPQAIWTGGETLSPAMRAFVQQAFGCPVVNSYGASEFLPLALSTVLEDDAGLFDFQLVQQGPCELLLSTGLRGQAGNSALRRARALLAAFLARQGAVGVQIHCRSGQPGRRGRSGKVQRVIAPLP